MSLSIQKEYLLRYLKYLKDQVVSIESNETFQKLKKNAINANILLTSNKNHPYTKEQLNNAIFDYQAARDTLDMQKAILMFRSSRKTDLGHAYTEVVNALNSKRESFLPPLTVEDVQMYESKFLPEDYMAWFNSLEKETLEDFNVQSSGIPGYVFKSIVKPAYEEVRANNAGNPLISIKEDLANMGIFIQGISDTNDVSAREMQTMFKAGIDWWPVDLFGNKLEVGNRVDILKDWVKEHYRTASFFQKMMKNGEEGIRQYCAYILSPTYKFSEEDQRMIDDVENALAADKLMGEVFETDISGFITSFQLREDPLEASKKMMWIGVSTEIEGYENILVPHYLVMLGGTLREANEIKFFKKIAAYKCLSLLRKEKSNDVIKIAEILYDSIIPFENTKVAAKSTDPAQNPDSNISISGKTEKGEERFALTEWLDYWFGIERGGSSLLYTGIMPVIGYSTLEYMDQYASELETSAKTNDLLQELNTIKSDIDSIKGTKDRKKIQEFVNKYSGHYLQASQLEEKSSDLAKQLEQLNTSLETLDKTDPEYQDKHDTIASQISALSTQLQNTNFQINQVSEKPFSKINKYETSGAGASTKEEESAIEEFLNSRGQSIEKLFDEKLEKEKAKLEDLTASLEMPYSETFIHQDPIPKPGNKEVSKNNPTFVNMGVEPLSKQLSDDAAVREKQISTTEENLAKLDATIKENNGFLKNYNEDATYSQLEALNKKLQNSDVNKLSEEEIQETYQTINDLQAAIQEYEPQMEYLNQLESQRQQLNQQLYELKKEEESFKKAPAKAEKGTLRLQENIKNQEELISHLEFIKSKGSSGDKLAVIEDMLKALGVPEGSLGQPALSPKRKIDDNEESALPEEDVNKIVTEMEANLDKYTQLHEAYLKAVTDVQALVNDQKVTINNRFSTMMEEVGRSVSSIQEAYDTARDKATEVIKSSGGSWETILSEYKNGREGNIEIAKTVSEKLLPNVEKIITELYSAGDRTKQEEVFKKYYGDSTGKESRAVNYTRVIGAINNIKNNMDYFSEFGITPEDIDSCLNELTPSLEEGSFTSKQKFPSTKKVVKLLEKSDKTFVAPGIKNPIFRSPDEFFAGVQNAQNFVASISPARMKDEIESAQYVAKQLDTMTKDPSMTPLKMSQFISSLLSVPSFASIRHDPKVSAINKSLKEINFQLQNEVKKELKQYYKTPEPTVSGNARDKGRVEGLLPAVERLRKSLTERKKGMSDTSKMLNDRITALFGEYSKFASGYIGSVLSNKVKRVLDNTVDFSDSGLDLTSQESVAADDSGGETSKLVAGQISMTTSIKNPGNWNSIINSFIKVAADCEASLKACYNQPLGDMGNPVGIERKMKYTPQREINEKVVEDTLVAGIVKPGETALQTEASGIQKELFNLSQKIQKMEESGSNASQMSDKLKEYEKLENQYRAIKKPLFKLKYGGGEGITSQEKDLITSLIKEHSLKSQDILTGKYDWQTARALRNGIEKAVGKIEGENIKAPKEETAADMADMMVDLLERGEHESVFDYMNTIYTNKEHLFTEEGRKTTKEIEESFSTKKDIKENTNEDTNETSLKKEAPKTTSTERKEAPEIKEKREQIKQKAEEQEKLKKERVDKEREERQQEKREKGKIVKLR